MPVETLLQPYYLNCWCRLLLEREQRRQYRRWVKRVLQIWIHASALLAIKETRDDYTGAA